MNLELVATVLSWGGCAGFVTGLIRPFPGRHHAWLVWSAGLILGAIDSSREEDYIYAGISIFFAAIGIAVWWIDGGDDDFRKRRKKLSAKAKAAFRKIKAFRPAPLRPPVPAGA